MNVVFPLSVTPYPTAAGFQVVWVQVQAFCRSQVYFSHGRFLSYLPVLLWLPSTSSEHTGPPTLPGHSLKLADTAAWRDTYMPSGAKAVFQV